MAKERRKELFDQKKKKERERERGKKEKRNGRSWQRVCVANLLKGSPVEELGS